MISIFSQISTIIFKSSNVKWPSRVIESSKNSIYAQFELLRAVLLLSNSSLKSIFISFLGTRIYEMNNKSSIF